uniref:Uncharacterized protein n=1 Tax=Moniliophthora roreri TaxID=221103 RepID=A0A0W0FMY9_MONRR
MSNASTSSSSSSTSSSQSAGGLSLVPTVLGEGCYGENITYQHGLYPNPYQLLHIFNSGHLFFLQSQCHLFEKIIDSCNLEIANQVMYACNYCIELEGPITVPSLFPYQSHLSMPPPQIPEHCQSTLIPSPSASSTSSDDELTETDTSDQTSTTLRAFSLGSPLNLKPSKTDSHPESPPLPVRPPNPLPRTPSFILTPLLIPTSNLRSSRPITPLPETLNLQPPLTPEVFRHLKHRFLPEVNIIPTVGGADLFEEGKDEDREN